jgi:predicted Zn-dependent protease
MARATGGGQKTPEFLSTHPSHETRIRDLIKWQPEAEVLFRASKFRGQKPEKLQSAR